MQVDICAHVGWGRLGIVVGRVYRLVRVTVIVAVRGKSIYLLVQATDAGFALITE
jgi:hypothetical protein